MANVIGMDPHAVRELARQLETSAGQINDIRGQLSAKLANTQWIGNDAQQFRSAWESEHVASLNRVIEALREAGRTASRNAQAQETTSSQL
ncbi:MAG TPA: WXG100 family type VII secretion target [Arachnia sp.]|nr:WXG100 family type VII secretion target [Arachnia sp.]